MAKEFKRRDLKEALRTIANGFTYEIDGVKFQRMANGVTVTMPESWFMESWWPGKNTVMTIIVSPKIAIRHLWRLINRDAYVRHDLFWEKVGK